jgi:hypothetical protein
MKVVIEGIGGVLLGCALLLDLAINLARFILFVIRTAR